VKAALGIACLLSVTSARAAAQQPLPQSTVVLPFELVNPGAKSLALGGAFVALADDATAAFANPAGLTQLNASEVSMELRGASVTSRYLQGGRISGVPTHQGNDTSAGAIFGEAVADHTGIGFIAGVYTHRSRRWVVAGYRHELLRVNLTFASNEIFQYYPGPLEASTSPDKGEQHADITAYGLSGSFKLSPNLSIGAGLTAYTFNLTSTVQEFSPSIYNPAACIPGSPPLCGLSLPTLNDFETRRVTQNGNSVSWAPTVGVLAGRDGRRFGAVYRRGASFPITSRLKYKNPDAPFRAGSTVEGRFRVPDTLAVGASFRVKQPLTLAVEVTRVWYSRLFHDFINDYLRQSSAEADRFSIRDGTEIHGGVQYAVLRWRSLPRFRGGFWLDPDHSLHYTAADVTTTNNLLNLNNATRNDFYAAALPKDTKRVHLTGGVGVTLGRHVELNAGFDRTSTTHVLSTSLIFRPRGPL
jgi:long-chain fatty acid transport protein